MEICVKTLANEYEGSATSDKGNSYLTKRTAYVDSSTGHDTTFTNDSRGRVLLQTAERRKRFTVRVGRRVTPENQRTRRSRGRGLAASG